MGAECYPSNLHNVVINIQEDEMVLFWIIVILITLAYATKQLSNK
jgi:hypothetical protein